MDTIEEEIADMRRWYSMMGKDSLDFATVERLMRLSYYKGREESSLHWLPLIKPIEKRI